MRRVRRDTASGGEIAMMAVITKAMGAFLVIMILLLPYYTSGPVAQRTAEQATEQVEQAKQQLREAQQALKKGRLTDEEIDDLLKQLEEALRQLEEALLYIRQLKIEVDQLTAQVNRLESEVEAQRIEIEAQRQEIAELRAEIERLKEELERLKRNQQPRRHFWNSVRLDWSGCWGARLNLYGTSDRADDKGTRNAPPNRTAQGPFFAHDKVFTEVTQWLTEGGGRTPMKGYITWVMDRLRADEVFTFYVKNLNALPDGPNECTLTARWDNRPGPDGKIRDTVTVKLGEKDPYAILVRLKGGERGSLSPQPVTEEQRQEFRTQISDSACEGIACGLDDPKAKPLFVQAIVDRFIGKVVPSYIAPRRFLGPADGTGPTELQRGETMLRVLGERYAAREINYATIDKWAGLFGDTVRRSGQGTASERIREIYAARLVRAGAPEAVVDLFRHRIDAGLFDMRALDRLFERGGIGRAEIRQGTPADQQAGTRLLDQWVKGGVEPLLAGVIARMVADGRLKAEPAQSLVAMIQQHRDKPSHIHMGSPAAVEMLRELGRLALRSGHPLHTALHPAASKVPPQLALPLVKQIEGF